MSRAPDLRKHAVSASRSFFGLSLPESERRRGSVADRCIPHAARTLYHNWNGSVPETVTETELKDSSGLLGPSLYRSVDSNFVTKREDAAAASKSFLRTCAPADGVDDVLSTVVSLLPQVEFWFSTTHNK